MAGFQKVTSGAPLRIPAADYNGAMDAAADFVRRRDQQQFGALDFPSSQTVIEVLNNGADVLDIGGIIGIDGPLFTPSENLGEFQYTPRLQGSTPTFASHYAKFAVSLGPHLKGEIKSCVIAGIAICKISVSSQDDWNADVYEGATGYLSGGFGSAEILYKESSGSTRWAVVRLGRPGVVLGKANADIAQGASGTFNVWAGAPGAEAANGRTITGYSTWADLKAAKWASAEYVNRSWYLSPLECA